jgi:hypothetical protein
MLLTHRKLLQSKAIAIENELRASLRNFGLKVLDQKPIMGGDKGPKIAKRITFGEKSREGKRSTSSEINCDMCGSLAQP